jgi:hypothetical protein
VTSVLSATEPHCTIEPRGNGSSKQTLPLAETFRAEVDVCVVGASRNMRWAVLALLCSVVLCSALTFLEATAKADYRYYRCLRQLTRHIIIIVIIIVIIIHTIIYGSF